MARRKYYIGVSKPDQKRPAYWKAITVTSEEELKEAQADVAEFMADDFLVYEDDDEEPV
ncbi:MAG TPA: hypothetical protein VJ836_00610 [Candidatus Saccharimonadales bacterium]|nr:hypothetical protein [Candidatus Saccharimonadales bacterium]